MPPAAECEHEFGDVVEKLDYRGRRWRFLPCRRCNAFSLECDEDPEHSAELFADWLAVTAEHRE